MALYLGNEKYNVNQYADGFEDGKKSQYDEFWDNFRQNGERTNYKYGFYNWQLDNFKPKYDIKPKGSIHSMFYSQITDFAKHSIKMSDIEQEYGITFDFSNANGSAQEVFRDCIFTELTTIDFSKVTDLTFSFHSSSLSHGIKRINRLILNSPFQFYGQPFGCAKLEYCGFEGVIDPKTNNLSLEACTKLAKECIVAFLNCLADRTSATSSWSITLGATNLAKLTDEEKAIATQKGWTLA